MKTDLQVMAKELPVLGRVEKLYAAAREVRALKRAGSVDYANAVLGRNGFGGNEAEIYFYRFASAGSPRPSNQAEFSALLSDPQRYKAYEEACYKRWSQGITAAQRVVNRYGGEVTVDDIPLDRYFLEVQGSGVIPNHRVHVKISIPGQDTLRQLRKLAGSA